MNLLKVLALISSMIINANGAPTVNHIPDPDSVIRLVNAAADDISNIAVAKAAAVGFAGGVAMNTVRNNIPNATLIYKMVANGGDAALKTASKAGKDTWNYASQTSEEGWKYASKAGEDTWKYVKDVGGDAAKVVGENVDAVRKVDPMEVLNDTESAVLEKNEAVLKAVFDAKRKAVIALQSLTDITGNFTVEAVEITNENLQSLMNSTATQWEAINTVIQAFWDNSLENLNSAITNAQSNLQASKETLSDIYNDITLENAQIAAHSTLVNAQNAAAAAQDTITQGVDTTLTITGDATAAAINSLVEAKSGIQDAAETFDSKTVIKNTKKRIGNVIVNTIEGAGNLLEQAGVYDAIDTVVHGLAGMPTKINGALEQAQDTISNSSVVLELLWEDQNKKEDLARTEKDDRDEIEGIEEDKSLEETIVDNDEVEDEIQSIEKEVEEVEAVNYLEDSNYETEAEKEIKTKTKEILELMETIQEDNNAIIR